MPEQSPAEKNQGAMSGIFDAMSQTVRDYRIREITILLPCVRRALRALDAIKPRKIKMPECQKVEETAPKPHPNGFSRREKEKPCPFPGCNTLILNESQHCNKHRPRKKRSLSII